MEKYYLGELGSSPDLERGIKFVEIHYARKAPSIGLVYLSGITGDLSTAAAGSTVTLASSSNQLNLAALQLDDNKEVHFSIVKRIPLPMVREALDFDTITQVILDGQQSQQNHLHCLILANSEEGSSQLFSVQFNESNSNKDAFKRLTGECTQANPTTGQLVRCLAYHSFDQLTSRTSDCCFVHLLAERSYTLCCVNHSNASLELLHMYLMPANEPSNTRFVDLHVVSDSANQNLLLLKLSNLSVKIVHKGNCVANFNLPAELTKPVNCPSSLTSTVHSYFKQQLILTSTNSDTQSAADEALLISSHGTKIAAHNLLIDLREDNERKVKELEDPDQLLPEEPGFELENCWNLDLYDLESIRALGEPNEQDVSQVTLCSMWSGNQQKPDGSWVKFLIVIHKFHLLVYTFLQQQPALPFSLVYDRAFLGLNEDEIHHAKGNLSFQQQQQQHNEYIDVKLRPRLIYNFKLIGPQPSDTLFNTLLLAPKAQLIAARHFPQLGLLAALSNYGHLYAFKFTADSLTGHKDSVYQQLLSESIRGSSRLFLDQIESLQCSNKQLQDDIANLESRLTSPIQQQREMSNSLDNLIHTNLVQRTDTIGYSYNLIIGISNLISISRIIVISTVNSCFLKPSHSSIHSIQINNNAALSKEKAILLSANIHQDDSDGLKSQDIQNDLHNNECPVLAYAILDLDSNFKSVSLSLPIYITDGQQGQLKVFYILSNSNSSLKESGSLMGRFSNQLQLEKPTEQLESVSRFHLQNVHINPLNSYQQVQQAQTIFEISKEVQLSSHITGPFKQVQIISWLNECFQSTTLDGTVRSKFTHCSIVYKIRDESIEISSDDIFAMEIIRKHIMKKATDNAFVVNVNDSGNLSILNLRHLIDRQHNNVLLASRLLLMLGKQSNSNDVSESTKTYDENLLFESLLSEMDLANFSIEGTQIPIDIDMIKDSMRKDIELLSVNNEHHYHQLECKSNLETDANTPIELEYDINEQEPYLVRDLICGYIIDVLVDFDRMTRGVRATNEAMICMRSKLIKIIDEELKSSTTFVEKVLNDWVECKAANSG